MTQSIQEGFLEEAVTHLRPEERELNQANIPNREGERACSSAERLLD